MTDIKDNATGSVIEELDNLDELGDSVKATDAILLKDNGAKKKRSKEFYNESVKNSVFTGFFVAFTLGIFAPTELFLGNVASFWFDFADIVPGVAVAFGDIFILVSSICFIMYLIARKSGRIACIFFSILTFMLYFQGNFMQINYGPLGGETIDFSQFQYEGMSNSVGWLGMIALFGLFVWLKKYEGYRKIMQPVMICLLLVQLITLVVVFPMSKGYEHKDRYVATTDGMFDYSTKKNMVLIIADTFDSRVLYDVLQSEDSDYCKTMLEDFTYYHDALSDYNLTDFSVPQMLTGEKYLNQCDFGDFLNDAFEASPLLNRLESEDWDMNICTTITLPQGEYVEKVSNWQKVDYSINDMQSFMVDYYKIIAFRYLPHVLKEKVYFNVDRMEIYQKIDKIDGKEPNGTVEYNWDNIYWGLSFNNMNNKATKDTLHVLHIKGIHSYRDLDINLNKIAPGKEVSLEESAKVVLSLLYGYTAKLKELGVYDDTIIIVAADHGASAYLNGWQYQNTVLLVKGINDRHDFVQSEAPISYDDLQNGYANLLDGKSGGDIFGIPEDATRERYTYTTSFKGALKSFSRNEEFIEYMTTAPAYDWVKTKRTGNKF